jgi:hypothetical protein
MFQEIIDRRIVGRRRAKPGAESYPGIAKKIISSHPEARSATPE